MEKCNFLIAAADIAGTKISIVVLYIGALAVSASVSIWKFIPGECPLALT